MPELFLTGKQVLKLVEQLEPNEKEAVLDSLSEERNAWREKTLDEGEKHLRQACAERKLDWDKMSEEEREAFVEEFLEEEE